MSNFLTNHPKLTIAFNGAVGSFTSYPGKLKSDAELIGAAAGIELGVGLIAGVALLPALAYAAGLAAILALRFGAQGAEQALKDLKTAKGVNERYAKLYDLSPAALQTANDQTTAERASRARAELKNTRQNLKKLLTPRHANIRR